LVGRQAGREHSHQWWSASLEEERLTLARTARTLWSRAPFSWHRIMKTRQLAHATRCRHADTVFRSARSAWPRSSAARSFRPGPQAWTVFERRAWARNWSAPRSRARRHSLVPTMSPRKCDCKTFHLASPRAMAIFSPRARRPRISARHCATARPAERSRRSPWTADNASSKSLSLLALGSNSVLWPSTPSSPDSPREGSMLGVKIHAGMRLANFCQPAYPSWLSTNARSTWFESVFDQRDPPARVSRKLQVYCMICTDILPKVANAHQHQL